jgi:hypothetical protein
MTLGHGPKIVTDGLVFAYDMSDPFTSKSWKGEPTTNVLPSPSTNGRFTTGNGWATYNTNQYNGAAFFSIGTIASVSGNLITTTTAHPLRTFDVVRPQTTGGGVTANVDYFVKKVSNTSFTLHAYNNNQNGSLGYILPSGFHKVHENIATDTRISVNSTNFPTMWWGAPHLPNSGIVKEIVPGGGRFKGTNAMRIHVTRTVGIDGMAYGVDTPATTGDQVYVSYWARTNNPGIAFNYQRYQGPGQPYYSRSDTLTADWQYITHTWTANNPPASNPYSFISYWFPPDSTGPYWVDMADLQVELNTQSGSTPFTLSSRSSTQALLDWTGNRTTTVNDLTYASDGTFSFDGSNDGITIPSIDFPTEQTIEIWLKPTENDAVRRNPYNQAYGGYGTWTHEPSGSINYYYGDGGGNTSPYIGHTSSFTVAQNELACVCTTRNTSQSIWYKNGVAYNSYNHDFGELTTHTSSITIGSGYAGRYLGDIYAVKLYTRALTAAEVAQNFAALRGRYGI